jgi:hypothetical protein
LDRSHQTTPRLYPNGRTVGEPTQLKNRGNIWQSQAGQEPNRRFNATAYQNTSAGIASGVDVSHRGGKPGFVRLDDDCTLIVPDFSGNCQFNTFGNLELNPRAGMLFVDFDRGNLLYLTGTAEVI